MQRICLEFAVAISLFCSVFAHASENVRFDPKRGVVSHLREVSATPHPEFSGIQSEIVYAPLLVNEDFEITVRRILVSIIYEKMPRGRSCAESSRIIYKFCIEVQNTNTGAKQIYETEDTGGVAYFVRWIHRNNDFVPDSEFDV